MALFARPLQPPHHDLGLHDDVPDDGDFFVQLNRVISKYEPPRHSPSTHPVASSSAGRGVLGSLQVNKELPPLPLEDESDEIPTQLPRQATGDDPPPPKTISLSLYPPPSPTSRVSSSSRTETRTSIPNSNFGTSTTNSIANHTSPTGVTPLPYDSPLIQQAGHLPAEPADQSRFDPEVEARGPPSLALQLVTQDHTPIKEKSPIQASSPLQAFFFTNRDPSVSKKSPALEKKPRGPRQTWVVFDATHASSGFDESSIMEDEPIVATLPTVRSSKSHPRRKHSLSKRPTGSIASPHWQILIPPSPNQPPQSTVTKRKRTEGIPPPSPNITYPPQGSKDQSRKRSRYHQHQLSRSFSLSSSNGTYTPLLLQPVYDTGPVVSPPSSAVEWVYPLMLTLEELFKGGTYAYQITTRLLSGEPKSQTVRIDVMPGWAPGTQIIVPNAGNECAPGEFQTMIFVVEQVQHEWFTRREGGMLEYVQDISLSNARNVNRTRTLCKVVGLDGEIIKFYPPRGAILHDQESVIKEKGMYKRSKGKVVGRGDLIIRWNITS